MNEQKKPKREAPQTKAKRLVAEYYNEHSEELGKEPVKVEDVRILMWRNLVREDTWSVILWIPASAATFFIVEHHKATDKTILRVYTDYVEEVVS